MNTQQMLAADFEAIQLTNEFDGRIKIEPIYFKLGFSPVSIVFARKAVLRCLTHALTFLPADYGFLVWDVYRPRAVQTKLFDWMRDEIRKINPQLSETENELETRKYVALPSRVGDAYCPPHLSGGAIDLTLFQTNNDQLMDMGTPFDDCTPRAHRDYFKNKASLAAEEQTIKANRELLRHAMEGAGFTSYQYEWWHFDLGNEFWSAQANQPVLFGPLFGDAEWPSHIEISLG